MKNLPRKLLTLLVTTMLVLAITGCAKQDIKDIKHSTNKDNFTDEEINWYSGDDWGASIDSSQIRVGDYEINGSTVSLITPKAAPGSQDQIFYNASGFLSNYKVSADLSINSMPVQEGVYNKLGFYAAYKDNQNFVWVYVHPLETEQFLSVSTMVNGSWELMWKIFAVPKGIDANDVNNLEIVKIDSEFRMYLNQSLIGRFEADIDEAQIGFLSDKIAYTASNIKFEEVSDFVKSTQGFGNSSDEEILLSGNYDVVVDEVILKGDENQSKAFYQETAMANYVIRTDLNYTALNNTAVAGFYASYVDHLNYVLVYLDNENEALVVEKVNNGVSELEATDISSKNYIYPVRTEIYKINDEGRVYLNSDLIDTFAVSNDPTTIGLYSQNADVTYSDFVVADATNFPVETWGSSYDGLITQRGIYQVNENNIIIATTAGGGYGEFEQVFYNGDVPISEFVVSSDIYIPDTVTIDGSTKYGYLLYNSLGNYLEVFVIPSLNSIYTVGKTGDAFMWGEDGYWHNAYTFEDGFDFTQATNLKVEKSGSTFNIYVNDALAVTLNIPSFESLEMQAALTGEKTAPIHFENFSYISLDGTTVGPTISVNNGMQVIFEQGSTAPDFESYISVSDNIDGDITVTESMIDTSNVNMDVVGTFDVYYQVTDSDGNTSTETIIFTITEPSLEIWGPSYDNLQSQNGTYTNVDGIITITETDEGAYGFLDQLFYNEFAPISDFEVSADITLDSSVIVDVDSKYGFKLYGNSTNYLEIFIIPSTKIISTVSQIDGVWGKLWTNEYTFADDFDFTQAHNLKVIKSGSVFQIYNDNTLVSSFSVLEHKDLNMQVGLISEKTAPVSYENFIYNEIS